MIQGGGRCDWSRAFCHSTSPTVLVIPFSSRWAMLMLGIAFASALACKRAALWGVMGNNWYWGEGDHLPKREFLSHTRMGNLLTTISHPVRKETSSLVISGAWLNWGLQLNHPLPLMRHNLWSLNKPAQPIVTDIYTESGSAASNQRVTLFWRTIADLH